MKRGVGQPLAGSIGDAMYNAPAMNSTQYGNANTTRHARFGLSGGF
jgi:hypothetical protein